MAIKIESACSLLLFLDERFVCSDQETDAAKGNKAGAIEFYERRCDLQ